MTEETYNTARLRTYSASWFRTVTAPMLCCARSTTKKFIKISTWLSRHSPQVTLPARLWYHTTAPTTPATTTILWYE
eukprot:scaffold37398_cov183-Amphora_coffeaeformis.AAC.3